MAMVRKIQHPGVQIEESEIGGYTRTVVMNNAYIMGFADRGPIYDYSWITTSKEFTKIYGEPQTEAEKYLFTAVQSVLNNGGTPIVARMPYDNKQCQAYKALKMKWMTESDIFESSGDADADAFDNGQVKNSDSPLVNLTKITEDIDRFRTFAEIVNFDSLTINDTWPSGTYKDTDGIEKEYNYLSACTLEQLVKQLNPYKSGDAKSAGILYDDVISEFKINGVYPSSLNVDQDVVKDLVAAISNKFLDVERQYSIYELDGEYKGINNAEELQNNRSLPQSGTAGLFGITELYLAIKEATENTVAYINLYGDNLNDRNNLPVYSPAELPDNIVKLIREQAYRPERELISSFLSGVTVRRGKQTLITDAYLAVSGLGLANLSRLAASGMIEQGETICYIDNSGRNFYKDDKFPFIYNGLNVYDKKSLNDASDEFGILSGFMNPKLFANDNINELSSVYLSATFIDDYPTDENQNNPTLTEQLFINNGTHICKDIAGTFKSYDREDSYIWDKFQVPGSGNITPIFTQSINGFELNVSGKINWEIISGYITGNDDSSKPKPININDLTNEEVKNRVLGFYYIGNDTTIKQYRDMRMVSGFLPIIENLSESKLKIYTENTISDLPENGVQTLYTPSASIISGYFDIQEELSVAKQQKVEELAEYIASLSYPSIPYQDIGSATDDDGKITCEYKKEIKIYRQKSLRNFSIKEIDEEIAKHKDDLSDYGKASLPRMFQYLNTIYNDARLVKKDKLNTIRFDAKLLNTPEMGFNIGLYLDSEDTEISNDQYDDLVTVNQFKAVDRTIDKYGRDIDDANFIIVDKQKTVVQGQGGNIGYFTTIIDPFDALKVQRTLVNPVEEELRNDELYDHSDANINGLDYWAYESVDSWNQIYDILLDSMDTLQRVRNADGVYIGEPKQKEGEKPNLLDSWAIPLTGGFYEESISKMIMKKFPGISMADIDTDLVTKKDSGYIPSIIDHQFGTHIMVAVCKTAIDQSTGKIVVTLIETFFGSLFNEKNLQNGRTLYIGDIINGNSDYIEFYRNNYVSAGDVGAYDPPEYRRTDVNQIFIKDSEDLRNAAELRGIDVDNYGLDSSDEKVRLSGYTDYINDLADKHIFVIDKKEVCVYNLHWEANFTSFSKKESQKVIANTANLYSVNDGTTINIAKNFLVDMDRCIKFIKNRDDIPLHFVCDAGLSTIAQFCDNVVWNPHKRTVIGEEIDPVSKKKNGVKKYAVTGGWITQPFSPDDDPDGEDRYITDYSDIATWRKVVEKIDEICSDIRKDCFAVIDAPRQLTLDGAAPKLRRSKFTNNFDKTIGRCLRYITGFNTSYSAGYYNWLRTTDQYTGKSIWIPPSTKVIGNYCFLNINNLPWLAPAGLTYGLVSGVHAISHNPDYQEEDQIYMKSWNYIKQYPVEGFVIEGQRTLLGKESVFERINVRLLFLDLERFAYNVSRTFKYQVNNTYTREQFVATLRPKFEDYTIRGGIYEYLIKVDDENNTPETIDANELRGDIFIKPARLIEFILLNFVGTTTGTDFTELALG